MSNSVEIGIENNMGGIETHIGNSTRAEVVDVPGVNIPLWFRRYLQATGQANAANPNEPAPATQRVAPTQKTPTFDFPKLCRDFASLGGKPYVGTEPYPISKA